MPPRRIPTTRQPRPQLLPLLLIICLALSLHLHISSAQAHDTYANHIPIRYKVNQKQTECLVVTDGRAEEQTQELIVLMVLQLHHGHC